MSSMTLRSAQLPWSEDDSERLYKKVLALLLALVLILGVIVPSIQLPDIERETLEKLPPQLAKVIKRKKEAPKPPPLAKIEKKIAKTIEKNPEPLKEVVKPAPIVPPVVKKVSAKPKVINKERPLEKVKAAKEKAQKMISEFSNDLSDMQNMLDMGALNMDSATLSTAGSMATSVGSVVDQAAVERISGVDDKQLTRETGADQLAIATRETTHVKELKKEELVDSVKETKLAGMNRSQMQIRRVFEQNKSRFDRIYRKALRSNPLLQGTVTLGVNVALNGEVSDCYVKSSDLQDDTVMKKIASTCKRLSFDVASKEDVFEYPLTFAP